MNSLCSPFVAFSHDRICLLSLAFFVASCQLSAQEPTRAQVESIFSRDNLIAWCIVPFDAKKRGPEQRAAMLQRLGFKQFAYDWREEHFASFDAELAALKRHGIHLSAFWFPSHLNEDARKILDLLKRHRLKTQLWITLSDPAPEQKSQDAKIAAAARMIQPILDAAEKMECTVGLYNHGNWFGEPENQLAIIERLQNKHVGIVYNLHHGHHHLDRFAELIKKMKPHLLAINLNGMVKEGDKLGKKILPLGQGDLDLRLLKEIQASGYRGPIGILGHTQDDAEDRLRDNLEGLDWLLPQLDGKPAGPAPRPRTYQPLTSEKSATAITGFPYSKETVRQLVDAAQKGGDARHGSLVFGSPQFACISCHKVGAHGGTIGPDLSKIGICLSPEQIVEALLWPQREVKEEYRALRIITMKGQIHQGYKVSENDRELVLREPGSQKLIHLARTEIEQRHEIGSLMPEGLATAMTVEQRSDLVRFLMELGRSKEVADLATPHKHVRATFPVDHRPRDPQYWPNWQHPVNKHRLYDFYAREADYFLRQPSMPLLLPEFPGIDGGKFGHWGTQNEATWRDERWNKAELGSVVSGVFHGNVTVPRGVCVQLGEKRELSVCFNPDTLCYEALWHGGFVKFSPVRHGFLHGLIMDGTPLPRPDGSKPERPFHYHGYYRHGRRVLFSYTLDGIKMLDAPWVENGKFFHQAAPADQHPLRKLLNGGPAQWPEVLTTQGILGKVGPYVIDTIQIPFDNPWKSPLFFGDHDFLPDGSALLCTMQGEVWHVEGLDEQLQSVRWRKIASGLHQSLGLVVAEGKVYVLGRDQITCLHDRNGDGETDFYECFSNAYITSPAGHDYLCGLQRDPKGFFYTASSKQGLIRISPDGARVKVLATGFRNPDGLGRDHDGALTIPCSEGDWTPASMICLVRPERSASVLPNADNPLAKIGGHQPPYFGYGGPKEGRAPDLPLVYLPRGLDNSSGGQVPVTSTRWGPMHGQMIHFSFGTGTHFLLLRDEVAGQAQGAVVPLPGEFLSGAHRGRFHPGDGQLYVTGMAGWGNYAVADGCFQRVRYTGARVQLPTAFHVHQNGILLKFVQPVEPDMARQIKLQFAQAWNYRYSAAYGSPEFSARHPGTVGHDVLSILRTHVLGDGLQLFLEMPDLQPVNQLHLHLKVDRGPAQDLYLTIHQLDTPLTSLPHYEPRKRIIAAHPILADLSSTTKAQPNPWRLPLVGARKIAVQADKNLTFAQRTLRVGAGETIELSMSNPDEVPHNWVLVRPGSLSRIGELTNRMVADPDAANRQYVPRSTDVLVYTDIVPPRGNFTISFRAPTEKGRYPYLCSFPGHWMVMNGELIVE